MVAIVVTQTKHCDYTKSYLISRFVILNHILFYCHLFIGKYLTTELEDHGPNRSKYAIK